MTDKARVDELVARLRGLLANATPGLWVMNPAGMYWQEGQTYSVPAIGMGDARYYNSAPDKYDAECMVEAVNALPALLDTIEAQAARIVALKGALKVFADCADELDGNEDVPRAPDGEWAKFRLLTDDYRAARSALNPEGGA